jgi:hypothetical protein
MNTTCKRACLYGGAVALLGAIGIAWQVRTTSADVMTLLSSVDVQLRLAHGIPELDKQGRPLDSRERMIASAEEHLAAVEQLQPGMAVAAEFTGFAQMLRGHYAEAAASYERAAACADCGPEQRDVLAFNQARMLAKAGRLTDALAVFGRHAKTLDTRFRHQRAIEEAAILARLDRADEAAQRLQAVLADAAAEAFSSLQAGVQGLELGRPELAEALLLRAAAEAPIADYHRARLKLSAGDTDSCFGLLERAAKAQPAEVRRQLVNDAAAWSAVASHARYLEITASIAAAPAR